MFNTGKAVVSVPNPLAGSFGAPVSHIDVVHPDFFYSAYDQGSTNEINLFFHIDAKMTPTKLMKPLLIHFLLGFVAVAGNGE